MAEGLPVLTTSDIRERICPKCRKILLEFIHKRQINGQLQAGKRDYAFICGVSSKYKGVMFAKWSNKWRARITTNSKAGRRGTSKHLGYFQSEIKAAMAYDEAAEEMHGDVVVLNRDLYPEDF